MRLLIVDATGYLFRAFHAVGDLRTAAGTPAGAIFGVVNMLQKLRVKYPAERTACVMDAPGKTFRHQLSPAYKANRPPIDPDLRVQIEPVKEFIAAMGWPLLCENGVEADDVIAALAVQGTAVNMEIIIASGDKDLMQFVGGNTRMYDGMKEKLYGEKEVQDKFGVLPSQISDFLSLVGDSSDNIRGVPKVGIKTAAKWLQQYGNLDSVIAAAADIKGSVGENLRASIANGELSLARQLTALKTDAVANNTIEKCIPTKPNVEVWQALCKKYEFRQLATAFDSDTAQTTRAKLSCIHDSAALAEWIRRARRCKTVAVDVETKGESVMRAQLVGFSLAADEQSAIYVPLAHHGLDLDGQAAPQIPVATALAEIKKLLEDEKVEKVFHNGKYDLHIFANHNLIVKGAVQDTKIAARLLSPGRVSTLSALAKDHLNIQAVEYKDVVDGKNIKDFSQVNMADAVRYAAEDAELTYKLRTPVVGGLVGAAAAIYCDIDLPLLPVLFSMERAGVRIDDSALRDFAAELRQRLETLETEAHKIAGGKFNLNSPRQLEVQLFDKMGASPLRKTSGGKSRSTDERTLELLADDYPLAKVALEHRTLAKLCGTYAEKLPQTINPQSQRVHTDFNQTAVSTGRLSSRDPNLQNIPIRTAAGRRIRQAFIAARNCKLISADYSQIELRLMAHISGDESLLDAFASGADIHRRTAAEIFDATEADIDGEQRRAAKAINFGLIYGMSAFGLARALKITQAQAKQYIEIYFARYPRVKEYMERTREQSARDGYVSTIAGRRIPTLGGNPQAAARAAINAPMQGSAADIIKKAMIAVQDFLHTRKMKTQIILQVHDELVLESPTAEMDCMLEHLAALMCGVEELDAPLEVSIHSGDNWDDAH